MMQSCIYSFQPQHTSKHTGILIECASQFLAISKTVASSHFSSKYYPLSYPAWPKFCVEDLCCANNREDILRIYQKLQLCNFDTGRFLTGIAM